MRWGLISFAMSACTPCLLCETVLSASWRSAILSPLYTVPFCLLLLLEYLLLTQSILSGFSQCDLTVKEKYLSVELELKQIKVLIMACGYCIPAKEPATYPRFLESMSPGSSVLWDGKYEDI